MDKDKLKGYINICRKAGYLIIGGEKLADYNKKLFLVLYDKNAMKNTMKVVDKIKEKNIQTIECEDLEEIVSIQSCKIIGIKNKNLSDVILNLFSDKGVNIG